MEAEKWERKRESKEQNHQESTEERERDFREI
jgi:hypothetical protein